MIYFRIRTNFGYGLLLNCSCDMRVQLGVGTEPVCCWDILCVSTPGGRGGDHSVQLSNENTSRSLELFSAVSFLVTFVVGGERQMYTRGVR